MSNYICNLYYFTIAVCLSFLCNNLYAGTTYCEDKGGTVKKMIAKFHTGSGLVKGLTKKFCVFKIDNGIQTIGLTAFSTKQPNIAASFIKTLEPITSSSPLWEGKFSNPSVNVCNNLGGATISFNFSGGGFSDQYGEGDVCVFGDGSMVSAWTLIYIANERNGYWKIRNAIRSKPLPVKIKM